MASSKEGSTSRPTSSGSFPHKNASSSRQHAHSVSLGAMNPTHRISRRKSVNSTAASSAAHAVAAALREHAEVHTTSHRRSLGSRRGLESTSMGNPSSMGTYFSRPVVGTSNVYATDRKPSTASIEDDPVEDEHTVERSMNTKGRNRRASEGAYLAKGEGKRLPSELRCDTCGKGYKHSSCLTKHMWEHDPAWALTSKLLISKHQQVQLLEAASVLVTMNADGSTPPDMSHIQDSECSSASPGFSGSSEAQDELSSTETTPPPMSDVAVSVPSSKRFSSSSGGFSRSYRSIPSSSFAESVASPGLPPHKFPSVDHRPATSGIDDGGLAAAAELLNFGTPRTRPTQMSPDVPPVPPLPEQYQSANKLLANSSTPTVFNSLGIHALTQPISDERDVRMQENASTPHGGYHGNMNMDEDEDDMFRMEE